MNGLRCFIRGLPVSVHLKGADDSHHVSFFAFRAEESVTLQTPSEDQIDKMVFCVSSVYVRIIFKVTKLPLLPFPASVFYRKPLFRSDLRTLGGKCNSRGLSLVIKLRFPDICDKLHVEMIDDCDSVTFYLNWQNQLRYCCSIFTSFKTKFNNIRLEPKIYMKDLLRDYFSCSRDLRSTKEGAVCSIARLWSLH